MSSKPKQTANQKRLEEISIEREKQLRVERARETTRAFSDNVAFRKKLRGIYSLLSAGFAGFQLGSGGGRQLMAGGADTGGGSASAAGGAMGTGIPSPASGGGAAPASSPRPIPPRKAGRFYR